MEINIREKENYRETVYTEYTENTVYNIELAEGSFDLPIREHSRLMDCDVRPYYVEVEAFLDDADIDAEGEKFDVIDKIIETDEFKEQLRAMLAKIYGISTDAIIFA